MKKKTYYITELTKNPSSTDNNMCCYVAILEICEPLTDENNESCFK